MRRAIIPAAVALVATLGGVPAWADVPRTISFQGRLSDASGTPVPSSNQVVRFKIYTLASGGSPCHDAAQTVGVMSGLLNAEITNVTGCAFATDHWLTLQIRKADLTYDVEMTPRIPLTAAAYALAAQSLVPRGTSIAVTTGTTSTRAIPLNDSVITTGLNAQKLDGYLSSSFSVCDSSTTGPDPTITAHRGEQIWHCTTAAGVYCPAAATANKCYLVGSCPLGTCATCEHVGYATQ